MIFPDTLRKLNSTFKNGVKIVAKETVTLESKMLHRYEAENRDSTKTVYLSADCAASIFDKHSNLNMVSISSLKSKRFGREYHTICRETCYTLYCDHKGFVPIREDEFPTHIGDYMTDVREGHCSFASNELLHGETIKRSNLDKTGTLGGFVDLPNGHRGFLTCSHVLHTLDELISRSFKRDELVIQVKDGRECNIGKIKEAVFMTDSQSEVSVDATLVQIEGNTHGCGKFPYMEDHQRRFTGIDR